MKKKLSIAVVLLLGLLNAKVAFAQIIDDSTKTIYGPKTTLQLFEQDVLAGRYVEERIDTTIQNFHNERYWYHDSTYFQTLGNVGTAAQPLLYQLPEKIGVRYGRNAFDRYAYDPYNTNYYNTRSPYSHLFYVQGGRGEQMFEAIYARNITPKWNIGAAYQIISSDKQLSTNGIGNGLNNSNGLISNKGFKVFSHYRSENDKYDLFANYTLMRQQQVEQGGAAPDFAPGTAALFGYGNQPVYLQNAFTNEMRDHVHLLQIFRLAGENLKLYHTLDWQKQRDQYEDNRLAYGSGGELTFYPTPRPVYNDTAAVDDEARYAEIQNAFGFTGNNKLSSYRAYIKLRNASISYRTLSNPAIQTTVAPKQDSIPAAYATLDKAYNQLFVGGQLRLFYQNKAELQVEGEYQITNDYHVRGIARLGGLQATLERVLVSPTITEQRLISNIFSWNNNFNSSVTDHGAVSFQGKLGERQFLKLEAKYTNIKRYIYYNTQAVPEQATGNQRFWGGELSHHIRFGPLHLENFVSYTNTDQADKVRVPEWFFDSKLYFQGSLFKKALYGQFGVEATMPTGYFADAYMPVTQQFYLQNDLQLKTYPVLDVFLTADIKTVNVFLKMSHANFDLWEPGYFATPYYPGMRRSFVFGIKWAFFD